MNTNQDLDALVEKHVTEWCANRITTKDMLKQCAIEWAAEVQSDLDEQQRINNSLRGASGFKTREQQQAIEADRDQWEARAEKAEVMLNAAIHELERVDNVKDGHPLVSNSLLYNLRSELAKLKGKQ